MKLTNEVSPRFLALVTTLAVMGAGNPALSQSNCVHFTYPNGRLWIENGCGMDIIIYWLTTRGNCDGKGCVAEIRAKHRMPTSTLNDDGTIYSYSACWKDMYVENKCSVRPVADPNTFWE